MIIPHPPPDEPRPFAGAPLALTPPPGRNIVSRSHAETMGGAMRIDEKVRDDHKRGWNGLLDKLAEFLK